MEKMKTIQMLISDLYEKIDEDIRRETVELVRCMAKGYKSDPERYRKRGVR